ncbi:leader peptidase (prepilin peptidase)/N-methyltransferase [Homoserinimonas aerilata]|uniref:Prepilin leader peptidase/N-methyltransferase n=1 Tax=Homoserinimonas aerilata TaxID=1162970 RepID=A0A542Y1G0_9MICO|nr:A24 family peptidase [Homoserinimonas aerilata]TQL41918.1 leader peptidase (prepilin peptidase)/N-methyltransferase [Homoserinimonas aerilata]
MTDALFLPVVIIVGILGLLIGSFLNVVVWRLPRGESLSHPRSACPKCGHPIRWWDNIPVVSWLVLRGRCRDCGEPISPRYPLVELATGLLFAGVAAWLLLGDAADGGLLVMAPGILASTLLGLAAFLYLAAISVALALIDLDTHTLPNKIVLPGYIIGGALLAASSVLAGDWDALIRAGIAMAAMFVAYLVMALAWPGGMGLGDVKLAGVLGIYLGWLGWGALLVGAFAAFVLGGIFSAVLLALRRANRKSGIPFGPWMLLGAWVGIFMGELLWQGYLSFVGLVV